MRRLSCGTCKPTGGRLNRGTVLSHADIEAGGRYVGRWGLSVQFAIRSDVAVAISVRRLENGGEVSPTCERRGHSVAALATIPIPANCPVVEWGNGRLPCT